MAHFYGTLQGARGEATRLGHKSSGMRTIAASWRGAVRVDLYVNETGIDCACVRLSKWRGAGTDHVIYDGPINEYVPMKVRETA